MDGGVTQVIFFLDSLPIGALVYDNHLQCVTANPKACMFIAPDLPLDQVLHRHAPVMHQGRWARCLVSVLEGSRHLIIQPVRFRHGQQSAICRMTLLPLMERPDQRSRYALLCLEEIGSVSMTASLQDPMLLQLAHQMAGILDGAFRSLSIGISQIDPDQHTKYLQACRKALEQAVLLLRQVLSTARTAGSVGVSLEWLIDQALTLVRTQAPSCQIEVIKSLANGLPTIRSHQLLQVFCNLIKNAFDAMPNGGRLLIDARITDGRFLEVSVADSGPGIDARIRDKIFEPFFTTKPGGTGLGLAICKDIVERLNGTIEVNNQPDCGAVFKIILPLPHVC